MLNFHCDKDWNDAWKGETWPNFARISVMFRLAMFDYPKLDHFETYGFSRGTAHFWKSTDNPKDWLRVVDRLTGCEDF